MNSYSSGAPTSRFTCSGYVADGNPERARQPLSRRRQQDIFDRRPRRGEIVERTLIRRPAQRAILLPEKRQYEAVALDEHPPLFGQSIDEHGAFVLIHRFGRLQPCLLDISGIFRYRRYEPCDVLPPAHDNELELPQMVVGRSLESRRQNFSSTSSVTILSEKSRMVLLLSNTS